jgi:hypothetical protein
MVSTAFLSTLVSGSRKLCILPNATFDYELNTSPAIEANDGGPMVP